MANKSKSFAPKTDGDRYMMEKRRSRKSIGTKRLSCLGILCSRKYEGNTEVQWGTRQNPDSGKNHLVFRISYPPPTLAILGSCGTYFRTSDGSDSSLQNLDLTSKEAASSTYPAHSADFRLETYLLADAGKCWHGIDEG